MSAAAHHTPLAELEAWANTPDDVLTARLFEAIGPPAGLSKKALLEYLASCGDSGAKPAMRTTSGGRR